MNFSKLLEPGPGYGVLILYNLNFQSVYWVVVNQDEIYKIIFKK